MRPIATAITLATFCLHVFVGCCAHHAHASELTSCCEGVSVASHEITHEHECDGHVLGSAQDCTTQAANDAHQGCHDVACSFGLSSKSELTGSELAVAITILANGCSDTTELTATGLSTVASVENDSVPPLPLYLFHQVLLI